MRKLVIPGTDLQTSRFIFGTGNLITAGAQSARRRLLAAAIEHGFTHFDTAPYYGFGVSERDLAFVLRRRPNIGITTKVGLYPPGGSDQPVIAVVIRKVGGKLFRALSRSVRSFDLERARQALEGSLRRLGRDYIDLYLLHEPTLDEVVLGAWLDWLQSSRRRGHIRHFGLAHTAPDRLAPFLSSASPLADVIQLQDSLGAREADMLGRYGRPLQITYGYVSATRASGELQSASEVLQRATQRNPHGPIIVSTTRMERVGQYARLDGSARD